MSEKNIYFYKGNNIDVTWDQRLCIHIGECGRAKGKLFIAGRKPWCQPDLVQNDEVVDVVKRCPTGSLSYQPKDSSIKNETPDIENTVFVSQNGPLYIRGDLDIDGIDQEDMQSVKFRAALCRCGKSANKPFCDNSHENEKFKDSGAVGETGNCDIPTEPETLTIKAAKNGPLLLSGHFKIYTASGRKAWQGNQAALCRCGQSRNKPFCDGRHKETGFTD